jgi:hypothetical protein
LVNAGVEIICLDVAHGHHILMERALKTLKDNYGKSSLNGRKRRNLGGFQ